MLIEGMFLGSRYEIIGKIGAGGMSDVYKAKDHTLGRFVAIKVLKAEFSEDMNFLTKFRSEAQSAAGLEHPNIVNIYDVGSENEYHYIVMEYVEGITLKTYIEKKGQLSFKEAVSIAIQVGRGIEAAHNKNIIHRDIKPQNIMISTEGKVKVTDFGIARAASSNTINSDVMGSVHYASPEQARNGFVDGKSDIYSLGIVMYEMVTGRVPFDGDTTVAVAIQHLQEEMVSPSAYAPNLPISMEKIILKCTQKNPDRRYESMTALLADLRKSLISPDEDFVVIAPISQDKTRVIGEDEVNKIKQKTNNIYLSEEELVKNALSEDEDEDDEDDEYDDDDEGLNPKMDKAITIMGIVAGIVIVGLIIFILVSFFGGSGSGKTNNNNTETQTTETSSAEEEGVVVPSLAGYTYDEAKDILNELGLGIYNAGSVSSDEYREGQIVSQVPEADEKVALHTEIQVTLSAGEGDVKIPSVTNLDENTAYSQLSEAGFLPVKDYAYSDTVAQGYVISQNPTGSTSAKKGTNVTIVISRGPEEEQVTLISVPNVYNSREDVAKQTLVNAGLTVGTSNTQYSTSVPEGNVISQDIASGTQVAPGTVVNLVVSLGEEPPQEITTPTYYLKATIGKPNSDAVAAANIYLYDAANGEGNILEQWTGQSISLFGDSGLTISKTGLLVSEGSLKIEWLDAEGNIIGSPQIENTAFKLED